MKKIYFALSISLLSFSIFAQQWSTLGTAFNGAGTAMEFYNGELVVAGAFSTAGGAAASKIAKWDGANWTSLGSGVNGTIYSMTNYHGQLIVAGSFTQAGGLNAKRIARWNGTSWDTLGKGINGLAVYALKVYNNKLYAAGKFGMAGTTPVQHIAVWNDTAWADVGGGINSQWTSPEIDALEVYNGQLYAGGKFEIAGTDSMCGHLASWNGNTWTHTGEGFYYTSHVYALAKFNGQLMIGGALDMTNNSLQLNNIATWDGTNFGTFGSGTDDRILTFYHYGTKLYFGGDFTIVNASSANHIAYWNGSNFSAMGSGCNNVVKSIIADEGIVFATGTFTTAGGLPMGYISKWSIDGTGLNEIASEEFSVYPNPSNGVFTFSMINITDDAVVEIYNSIGEIISESKINAIETTIDLSAEAKGIYFYRMVENGVLVAHGKVAVE